MARKNYSVLVISDQHFPYNHPDLISFLRAIKKHYQPDRVVNIGDEIDYHAISFHESNPDLLSPGDELQQARKRLESLYEMFPVCDVLESNHGSLVYRKGKTHGLPRHVFKSYREVLEAPRGWKWHMDLTIRLPNDQHVYFHHGKSARPCALSQSMSMNAVQGHFHERFYIHYWANPNGLFWQMQVGCLIDDTSMAYSYNNANLKRPIIGVGMIINSHPRLIPMVLNKNGRWTGRLV